MIESILRFFISIPVAFFEALIPGKRHYGHEPPQFVTPPTMPPPKPRNKR